MSCLIKKKAIGNKKIASSKPFGEMQNHPSSPEIKTQNLLPSELDPLSIMWAEDLPAHLFWPPRYPCVKVRRPPPTFSKLMNFKILTIKSLKVHYYSHSSTTLRPHCVLGLPCGLGCCCGIMVWALPSPSFFFFSASLTSSSKPSPFSSSGWSLLPS